jgi:hypothetical protein
MPFSEAAYYREFKRVRNRFRRYDPIDTVLRTVKYANGGENQFENLKRWPWLMMLMVKWILTDDNFTHPGRSRATERDLNILFQAALDLSDWTRMPNEYEHIHLFMRSIGHQQFLFQKDFSFADFARQFVLFADLDDQHKLSRAFRDAIGLDIEEFLILTMALAVKYHQEEFVPVYPHWFSALPIPNADHVVQVFLSSISATPSELRIYLLSKTDRRRSADEYVEQTPLIAKPLLNLNGAYWPVHRAVLFRGLEHYIYDHLRAIDPEWFMQSFGKIFERYVNDVVSSVPYRIYTEDELKKLRKSQGKVVDFVVEENNANIFIDAKGVAGTHEAMVTHASQILRDRTKAAALKAVIQANELLEDIVNGSLAEGGPKPKEINILLVVTYKDLHLGNGRTFEQAVAPADIMRIYEDRTTADCIPLENIYFLSIDSFEALCGAVESGHLRFSEAILKAREADSDVETKKFDFKQHLAAMKVPQQIPGIVRDRLDKTINYLVKSFS